MGDRVNVILYSLGKTRAVRVLGGSRLEARGGGAKSRRMPSVTIVHQLTEPQLQQLHALYQGEWWCKDRSLEETRQVIAGTDFLFAAVKESSGQLLAFARVLSDRVFKAFVFDVIVHPEHRGEGLGRLVMQSITSHPVLSRVLHLELYCLPERRRFYEQLGFTSELGDLVFMRRARA